MQRVRRAKRTPILKLLLLSITLIILALTGAFTSATTLAMSVHKDNRSLVTCPAAADPTSRSLLVVLLDRSGSLVEGNAPTDPNRYSTSVTKALADLWPGLMAVIPFSGDTTSLPVFGPAILSDPTQLANLKNKVEGYPIGGDTPLGPAMHQALKLLQGAAAGSRVIIVTDGNPTGLGNNDGSHQEDDIRHNLISQFCDQGIPVSAFGLTINENTPDGQDANRLLTDITNGTGAAYSNVTRPEDLARAIISLYAQWLHLSFTQDVVQNGNAHLSIDTHAQRVTILTFRSAASTSVILDGPDGQPIQGVQSSEDRHYAIDNLSGVFVAGTYTIHTSNDPDVQVYTLVNSPLQIQITAPTLQQKLRDDKPIEIMAKFVDNNGDLTPRAGQAAMVATVKLLVSGKVVKSGDIDLSQTGALFKGQTGAYGQVGELQIEVKGTYQGVQRETSTGVQLVTPPIPPPPPCKLGVVGCTWQQVVRFYQQHQALILALAAIVFLLLLLLIWLFVRLSRPKPFGWVCNDKSNVEMVRFHKPVISSTDIQSRGRFNFNAVTRFELVFKKDGRVLIRSAKGNGAKITVTTAGTKQAVAGQDVELKPGSTISDGRETAFFLNTPRNAGSFLSAPGRR